MPEIDEDLQTIKRLLPAARALAAKVGPMHTLWDFIQDGEAVLAGREPLLAGGAANVAHVVAVHFREVLADAGI